MRKNIIWAVIVIAAGLLQVTWLEKLKLPLTGNTLPDLMVLLVIYFALMDGPERAMFTGALGGLFSDVLSNSVLGHHILCYVVIGYAAGRMSGRLVTYHPAVKAGLVLIAGLAKGLLSTAILYIQRPDWPALHELAANVVPGAFYTAIITPLVFWILGQLLRRFVPAAEAEA